MKPRELQNLGIPKGDLVKLAGTLVGKAHRRGMKKNKVRDKLKLVIADPASFVNDGDFAPLAEALSVPASETDRSYYVPRERPAPWRQWGKDLEKQSVQQMVNACQLPVAAAGALMPDAHLGYGLPIGGVLATNNAVIPYAVGVDIACRMKLSVLDLPVGLIKCEPDRLIGAIERETRFGVGVSFQGRDKREHAVMDEDWSVSNVSKTNKDSTIFSNRP